MTSICQNLELATKMNPACIMCYVEASRKEHRGGGGALKGLIQVELHPFQVHMLKS